MRTYTFAVPALPPPEASPNSRAGWAARWRATETYMMDVLLAAADTRNRLVTEFAGIRDCRDPHFGNHHTLYCVFQKARLDLTFVFPHLRGRDEDNLRASFKAGQDALVRADWLPDDRPDHLAMGAITIEVDKSRAPLTIITLTEVPR